MLSGEYLESEFPKESSLDDLINGLDLEDVPVSIDDSIQVLENELNNLTWPHALGTQDLEDLDLELEQDYSIHDDIQQEMEFKQQESNQLKKEMENEVKIKNLELNQVYTKLKTLELEVATLKKENSSLKEENESIQTIKESLKEEKELEMLEFKKETLLLKEKQLKEFVSDWNLQKEDLSKKYSMDLTRIQRDFEKEKLELSKEMTKLESEKDLLQQKLYDQDRKSRKSDFECQTVNNEDFTKDILLIFNQENNGNQSILEICKNVKEDMDKLTGSLKEKDWEIQSLKVKLDQESQKIATLKEKGNQDVEMMKKVHSAEIEALKALSESKKVEKKEYEDLDSVLNDFPNLHSEFKDIVYQKVEKSLAEQRCKNSDYLDQVLMGHQNQITELIKSFEAEREAWRKERSSEIMALTAKLKNTCSDAYSSSISRVQTHIEAEKRSLLQDFEHDKQLLKDSFSKERDNFRQEMSRLKKQHSVQIKDLKEKYLVILKQMRSDLVSSKANTLERLELEWKRRKNTYEDKMRQIKLHLSTHPIYCKECMDLFSR